MPGGDRTGPVGAGPMTGRALGLCAGNTVPGYSYGRGGGFARGVGGSRRSPGAGGRGRGRMNRFYATGLPGYAREDLSVAEAGIETFNDVEMLRNRAEVLAKELEFIKEKLEVLENGAETQSE